MGRKMIKLALSILLFYLELNGLEPNIIEYFGKDAIKKMRESGFTDKDITAVYSKEQYEKYVSDKYSNNSKLSKFYFQIDNINVSLKDNKQLNISVSIGVKDAADIKVLEKFMPLITDTILNTASNNTSFAISFEKGRRLMSYKIADEINSVLDKNIVLYVYFKDFIIK